MKLKWLTIISHGFDIGLVQGIAMADQCPGHISDPDGRQRVFGAPFKYEPDGSDAIG